MTMVLLLSILSIVSAFSYGIKYVHERPSDLRTACKATAVGSLAGISFAIGGPALLTCALVLGAVGDVSLSREGKLNFVIGLFAFLLGHLAYIAVLWELAGPPEWLLSEPLRLAACVLLLVSATLIIRRLLPHLGSMRIPVLVYAFVILVMGIVVSNLPISWPLILAMPGVALFITSDAILGFELFMFKDASGSRRRQATLLWLLYWSGQTLILLATIAV